MPALPFASSLTRRKSFPSLDPGLLTWEARGLLSVGTFCLQHMIRFVSENIPLPAISLSSQRSYGEKARARGLSFSIAKGFLFFFFSFWAGGSSWPAIYNGKVPRTIALRVPLCHSAWHSSFHSQEGEDYQHFMSRIDFI